MKKGGAKVLLPFFCVCVKDKSRLQNESAFFKYPFLGTMPFKGKRHGKIPVVRWL